MRNYELMCSVTCRKVTQGISKVFEVDMGERKTRPPRVGGHCVTLTGLPSEPAQCAPSARPLVPTTMFALNLLPNWWLL